MSPMEVPILWGKRSQWVGNSLEFDGGFVRKDFDPRIVVGPQQSRPIRVYRAPQLFLWTPPHEGALCPIALDKAVLLESVQGLPDCHSGNAKLSSQLIDRGDSAPKGPMTGLNPAPEQRRKLNVS
jgi:hypothetical protein